MEINYFESYNGGEVMVNNCRFEIVDFGLQIGGSLNRQPDNS